MSDREDAHTPIASHLFAIAGIVEPKRPSALRHGYPWQSLPQFDATGPNPGLSVTAVCSDRVAHRVKREPMAAHLPFQHVKSSKDSGPVAPVRIPTSKTIALVEGRGDEPNSVYLKIRHAYNAPPTNARTVRTSSQWASSQVIDVKSVVLRNGSASWVKHRQCGGGRPQVQKNNRAAKVDLEQLFARSGRTSQRSISHSASGAASERRSSISMASASLRHNASAPSSRKFSTEYPRGVWYGRHHGPQRKGCSRFGADSRSLAEHSSRLVSIRGEA